MHHVILLGDSIFDNAGYVPGGPSVIEHLQKCLPGSWLATLLAVDGSIASDVARQLTRMPEDATHLVISSGGNNALDYSSMILHDAADSFTQVLDRLAEIRQQFQHEYRTMLQTVLALGKPTTVCTIYDVVGGIAPAELTGLCLFNDVILREAFRVGVPVIDLRLICTEIDDYAKSSPIEPSVMGGGKIVRTISRVVTGHDFGAGVSQIYT